MTRNDRGTTHDTEPCHVIRRLSFHGSKTVGRGADLPELQGHYTDDEEDPGSYFKYDASNRRMQRLENDSMSE